MRQAGSASGGVGTAAGLGYQYLVTVEDVLNWMENHPGEGFVLESEDHASDVVDYSITALDGVRLLSVQAKSSVDGPGGPRLGASEIMQVLLQLIEHDAQRYVIRTNRPLAEASEVLRAALSSLDPSTATSATAIEAIRPHIDPARLTLVIDSGTDLSRLARCTVCCEPVDLDALRLQIEKTAQRLRRLHGNGTGRRTAEVLVGYLTSQILHLSSRREGRSLDRARLERLVGTPAPILAGAAGAVDWGVPIGPVPTTRAVDRIEVLSSITTTLAGPPVDSERRIALTGLSGIGKSTVARLYLDAARHYYDRITWIDAHRAESIRDAVTTYIGVDTADVSIDTAAERFKAAVSSAPATWLLVFDNAPDDRTVAPWLPVGGAVDVIATSTNSTGWGQWRREHLEPMTEPQALALVRERLDLERIEAAAMKDAQRLCDAVGYWPLAIELACAFLADSGRGLAMTDVYLEKLKRGIIDDATLVPPEYRSHPTLLQAISIALETVASRDEHLPLRAMALLETLAYLPPRSTPLQLAGRVTAAAELSAGRYEIVDDDALERDAAMHYDVDTAVRQLETASLAHPARVSDTPLGVVLRTNEIILDVVRGRHGDDERALVLALLHTTLNSQIMSAVDEYQFSVAETLAASALKTIDFSERFGIHTREGITLIGNLAAMFHHRGALDKALSLYRREVATVDRIETDAPVLRAKIFAGISDLQLRTNAPVGEIQHTIDSAMYYLGRCAIDSESRASAAVAATQVYETVQMLVGTALGPEVTDPWTSFLSERYPDVAAGSCVRVLGSRLGIFGNDDEVTLAAIENSCEVEDNPVARLQLLFLRADALASLKRYEESIETYRMAFAQSDARAVGLGPGWVNVLNAWKAAAFLALGECDFGALKFCQQMDTLVGGQEPIQEDDRVTVELCRVATRVLDRPLREIAARLERLSEQRIRKTYLTPHPEGVSIAIAACQRIAQLRRSVAEAPIIPIRAWGRGQVHTPYGLQRAVVVALDLSQVEDMPSSGLTGRWVCDKWGVGLATDGALPLLAWSPTFSTWWMECEGATVDPANTRLREVITSPEFVAYRADVLVGAAYDGSDTGIIDPSGPTAHVMIRD